MLDWFFGRWHKVKLSNNHIMVVHFRDGGDHEFTRSPELSLWLSENPCKFRLQYDTSSGARWIEFKDRHMAALCKLTLS